jgi:hypothetical protein
MPSVHELQPPCRGAPIVTLAGMDDNVPAAALYTSVTLPAEPSSMTSK